MESLPFPGPCPASPLDLIAMSPTPMVLVDTGTRRIRAVNAAAEAMFSIEAAELVGKPLDVVLAFDIDPTNDTPGRSGHGVAYHRGTQHALESVHVDYKELDGDPPLTVMALFDYTRVGHAVREELEAARTDSTTGALRRDSFLQLLNSYGQHPSQSRYGVLFLDIDRFKRFNDEFGHQFGDTVLATVVEVLRGMLRASDEIGRFGGDEFVVLLSGPLDFGDVERIASHVARRVASAVSTRVGTRVEVSVGAAYCTSDTTATQALRAADTAMYGAKRRKFGDASVSVVAADHKAQTQAPTHHELLVT